MLKTAVLMRRYKRFLVDIQVDDGEVLTIHCPNTGAMKNCALPGSRIWYSTSNDKNRKYPHTRELIQTPENPLVGVNTRKANRLVTEAIESDLVEELTGYSSIQAEVLAYRADITAQTIVLQDQLASCWSLRIRGWCI
ncbi:MAG: hypothetical protein QGD92_12530 [Gammaproteobacteria bacterium]|nr:hypothetical protein [Gammaproteobacteria bacterium]